MNYTLNHKENKSIFSAIRKFLKLIIKERKRVVIALIGTAISLVIELISPYLIGRIVDEVILKGDVLGLLHYSLILLLLYLVWMVVDIISKMNIGIAGRNVLFNLRNNIFDKMQSFPIEFFNQNKNGDLISRMNNDTDKVNIFISQGLVFSFRAVFGIISIAILLLFLNIQMGCLALIPAVLVLMILFFTSSVHERLNRKALQSLGSLSAEIQESLASFKVVLAFNRQDYFLKRFSLSNENNFKASVKAEVFNKIFIPLFDLAANIALVLVLFYGIYLIQNEAISIGLLISYILYLAHFYDPLKHVATIWPSFQIAMAALNRIDQVLETKIHKRIVEERDNGNDYYLEFSNVSFGYSENELVIDNLSMSFEKCRTYAFVGPTGGGKTTIASLMTRLYDPISGVIFLEGKDLRSYSKEDLSRKIGFILQDAFVFTGSLMENIVYGNPDYMHYTKSDMLALLKKEGLDVFLEKFPEGLDKKLSPNDNSISLGEKQLVAFMRAVLRRPEILILDEATANIDTVTEDLLEIVLSKLPKETIKVIIAHRLNTIQKADKIFFVNYGKITEAGSIEEAVNLLIKEVRRS